MSESYKQASKQRLDYLDAYKGVCILFIIFTHAGWSDQQRLRLFFPFWIDMAVPVFMVITGFVSAMSFSRKQYGLRQAYQPKAIMTKWLRFIIPFTPVFLAELFAKIIILRENVSLLQMAELYITGAEGPGSYYFPVMLQVVLMFPLIWWCVSKYQLKGLLLCFSINVGFEALKTILEMPVSIYRLCAFRYIFLLAYGSYLFSVHEREQKNSWAYYLAGVMGAVYIIGFNYYGLTPVFTEQWKTTCVFAVLFIVPIMKLLVEHPSLNNRLLQTIGKASFNIFLTQMMYYAYGAPLLGRLHIPFLGQLIINYLMCCSLGVLFYIIESPFTKKVIKML